jgi:hypothetical protein
MALSLRRLVLLVVALGGAAALLIGVTAVLAPAAPDTASPVVRHNQVGALERDVAAARPTEEPVSNRSRPFPVVALVLGGLVLLSALPPAHRVHVHYHRSSELY